ncbi:cellulose biosynthesis protein BcsP [Burkholderia ubonensis]|uniref:cellulose biosynthesis protein BcsP n=1 Tax=Burkholderia ubonensis TaxID=101571 RepID=UPI000A3EF3B1|nr:cellulose biosynthesis protein BcsP [Burkholderia ubonensis]
MTPSHDISTLFARFGGDASDYQETGREAQARRAHARWPLLAIFELSQPPIPVDATASTPSLGGGHARERRSAKADLSGHTPRQAVPPATAATREQARNTPDTPGASRCSSHAPASPLGKLLHAPVAVPTRTCAAPSHPAALQTVFARLLGEGRHSGQADAAPASSAMEWLVREAKRS